MFSGNGSVATVLLVKYLANEYLQSMFLDPDLAEMIPTKLVPFVSTSVCDAFFSGFALWIFFLNFYMKVFRNNTKK